MPAATPRRTLAALLLATSWPLALPVAAAPLDPRAFASLGVLDLAAGSYTLDSGGALPRLLDSASKVLAWGSFQGQADGFNPLIAVFSFDSVRIDAAASLRASGANPVALLSRQGITVGGVVDAAGRQGGPQGAGVGGAAGPGGGRGGDGGGEGRPGAGPGGGAGGYPGLGNCGWGEGGAYGGGGSNWNPCRSAARPYGDPAVRLQAGSGGGGGGANLFGSGPGGGGGGGGLELGALDFITLVGRARLSVAGGDFADGLAVNAGGGAGGGVLLHAPVIDLQSRPEGAPVLDASGFSGGRISFLAASGGVLGNTAGVTVAANFWGQPGVITYGTLAAVPEPASALLLLSGGVALLAMRRRRTA